MSNLQGKSALVTGGTSGIGLATARAFRDAGARVIVTGSNPETLQRAHEALGDRVVAIRSDARSVADAKQLAAEIERRFGGLDIAFLNAGVAKFVPLAGSDEALFDEMFDINVKGVVFTANALLPLLKPGASLLVNTSVVAHKGVATASVYSATKGALSAFVRSLAVELAEKKVRVNAISPGPIETPIYGKLGLPTEAVKAFGDALTAKVPLHRFGTAEEIANAALFLASPDASYITGAELAVDGGLQIA